jgi:hypothetical protein
MARTNSSVFSRSSVLGRVVANVALRRRILDSGEATMLFIVDTFIRELITVHRSLGFTTRRLTNVAADGRGQVVGLWYVQS